MNKDILEQDILLEEKNGIKKKIDLLLLLVIIILPFIYIKINPIEILKSYPSIFKFFGENFFPPNFSNFSSYIYLIIETIFFAVISTYISAILAFILGLLLSRNINTIAPIRMVVRVFATLLRNIPVLVWASLLVYIFGIGSMVGVIALILTTLGFLIRSYAETIDEIADNKLEALRANGATIGQIIVNGLIPEFTPSWINWTLFSFEINIRASVILGMVGAGGIGIIIQTNIRLFKYHEAFALIIILVCLILVTELVVNKIRKLVL